MTHARKQIRDLVETQLGQLATNVVTGRRWPLTRSELPAYAIDYGPEAEESERTTMSNPTLGGREGVLERELAIEVTCIAAPTTQTGLAVLDALDELAAVAEETLNETWRRQDLAGVVSWTLVSTEPEEIDLEEVDVVAGALVLTFVAKYSTHIGAPRTLLLL